MTESINDYREHLWENCKALWMIWVPAQMVNFTVVPLHLRIPFGEGGDGDGIGDGDGEG